MTSTTTSIYATFADYNADTIATRARAARAAGDGMSWGEMEHTPTSAAREMGAIILYTETDGAVVCELSDRLYMVCDCDGPWAVEVATQEDLDDDASDDVATDDAIRALATEAGAHGDEAMVAICEAALAGDAAARAECERVMREARAA